MLGRSLCAGERSAVFDDDPGLAWYREAGARGGASPLRLVDPLGALRLGPNAQSMAFLGMPETEWL
jgi:hypothetical protein